MFLADLTGECVNSMMYQHHTTDTDLTGECVNSMMYQHNHRHFETPNCQSFSSIPRMYVTDLKFVNCLHYELSAQEIRSESKRPCIGLQSIPLCIVFAYLSQNDVVGIGLLIDPSSHLLRSLSMYIFICETTSR